MQDIHDERSVPLQPEPLTPRESKFFRLMAFLGLREKNQHDEKVAKAAEANRPFREAEARRKATQPGADPHTGGFASLAALPVIGLACVAILYAVAVLS
jgi:hypothetical protein